MGLSEQTNFIDLFFLILCLRIIYITITRGVLRESFKLAGLLIGSLCAFHFYNSFAQSLGSKIAFLNKDHLSFISFLLIFGCIVLVFILFRMIVTSFFKTNEISFSERWLLAVLGVFRTIFLLSIIFFIYFLFPTHSKYPYKSISYRVCKNLAPKIYLASFRAFNSFGKDIKLNKEVELYHEAKKVLPRDSK